MHCTRNAGSRVFTAMLGGVCFVTVTHAGSIGVSRGDHVDLEEGELLDRFSVHPTSDRVHGQASGCFISGAENRVSGSQETLRFTVSVP